MQNHLKVSTFDQMLEKKYTNIIYFIGLTIAITIAIQFYWNLKIYGVQKQQLSNQVQVSFDKAIDDYYNDLAKSNILTFIDTGTVFNERGTFATIKNKNIDNQLWIDGKIDSNNFKNIIKIRSNLSDVDSLEVQQFNISDAKHISISEDELDTLELRNLTTKIMFSFQEKLIDFKKVDSLLILDLKRKNIEVQHGFVFTHQNFVSGKTETINFNSNQFNGETQVALAKSSFLPHQSELKLLYNTSTLTILSTMIGSIGLSLLLSAFIIGCLLFLLKIIFKQKQLSEVKNDLISNITHEFKTPIATISVALEGLQNFDAIKNPKLTENYLSMSNIQLKKLNTMVEKLLETASLKDDHFNLNKETFDVVEVLKSLINKHQISNSDKNITLNTTSKKNELFADKFHFENALNNIIDNAIKYGGNEIAISINNENEIFIEDNGEGIAQNQQKKIFEQFYRIPTGNVHDIKGFGIGLYYTKQIIEKHNGTISVESRKGKTIFKIKFDNGSKN